MGNLDTPKYTTIDSTKPESEIKIIDHEDSVKKQQEREEEEYNDKLKEDWTPDDIDNKYNTDLEEALYWVKINNTNNLPQNYYNETPLSKDTSIVTKDSPIPKKTIEYEEPKQPGQLKPQGITIDNSETSIPNPF